MNITTKFNNSDKVYYALCRRPPYSSEVVGPLTIGQIQVEVTDSPGISNETIFNNYKPQTSYKEEYMAIETGIGGGSLYAAAQCFTTVNEAQQHIDKYLKEL